MWSILPILFVAISSSTSSEATQNFFRSEEMDFPSYIGPSKQMENSTLALGCIYCGDIFYHEPPPADIMFIPPPPIHPSYQAGLLDTINPERLQNNDQCSFCNIFSGEGEQLMNHGTISQSMNNRFVALLVAFLTISIILFVYLVSTRRSKIIASLARARLFNSGQPSNNVQLDKDGSVSRHAHNAAVHLSDPCYLQTNQDKNLMSPMISDHIPHKKTSIPSKYWAQPGSVIGRTIRRIPNEYEIPSSRTNSTGTSSAVYGDMNNESNQRFFSPYNLHTYAEVREVVDPADHFQASSNSSVMMSESNYDNAVYTHGNCVLNSGAVVTAATLNGSVQMSDFNYLRPSQSITYGQPTSITHHHLNQPKSQHIGQQSIIYEQPPQRAQIIITSNNQGANPTLMNYKERIHNVI